MSEVFTDPFGKALMAYQRGEKLLLLIRRDDGYVDEDTLEGYFKEHNDWLEVEKRALRWVKGRVLDVGCGPGRHLLWLQESGFTVTGIDVSPLAVEVARIRGARDCRIMDARDIMFPPSSFETILMMGNNFGIAGDVEETREMLRAFHRITTDEGCIIATSIDPLETDRPSHLAYHERNRQMGRPPGLVTLRLEFMGEVSPWFNLLLAMPEEMAEIAEASGWQLDEIYRDKSGRWRGLYSAILVKKRTCNQNSDLRAL